MPLLGRVLFKMPHWHQDATNRNTGRLLCRASAQFLVPSLRNKTSKCNLSIYLRHQSTSTSQNLHFFVESECLGTTFDRLVPVWGLRPVRCPRTPSGGRLDATKPIYSSITTKVTALLSTAPTEHNQMALLYRVTEAHCPPHSRYHLQISHSRIHSYSHFHSFCLCSTCSSYGPRRYWSQPVYSFPTCMPACGC